MEKENILRQNYAEAKVKDEYSGVAWFYNFWSWLTESKSAKKVIELAHIQSGERILEVAVGTGAVFAEIVRRNTGGVTEGIDVSPSMMAKADERMKKYPKERYRLQIASAYKLPFDSNTFDLLVNNFMIDLLPEKDFPPLLSEYYRVLKPGGRIVISTMSFGTKWYNKFWQWLAKHFPALLTGCRPISIKNYLTQAQFDSIESVLISQNTFPSEVLKAGKAAFT
ncbi:MAG: methyltransferase domain-containing protein [Bacteroidota bacterium]|nr:methyltransferase domain-containing protein [Bacteroidota bacterium]